MDVIRALCDLHCRFSIICSSVCAHYGGVARLWFGCRFGCSLRGSRVSPHQICSVNPIYQMARTFVWLAMVQPHLVGNWSFPRKIISFWQNCRLPRKNLTTSRQTDRVHICKQVLQYIQEEPIQEFPNKDGFLHHFIKNQMYKLLNTKSYA